MTVQIYRLPALTNNYIFLLHDPQTQKAAVIDPAEPQPVLRQLETLGARLTAIFNTHHHSDHVGANRSLLRQFPQAEVYGGKHDRGRIPEQRHYLEAGDQVTFAQQTAQVLFVPGHTRAHIAYYFPPMVSDAASEEDFPSATNPLPLGQAGDLFCGDTLFAGGCGRLFEGTPSQMVSSLNQIRQLPDSTRIWCAHEYTLNNLEFALTIDRQNKIWGSDLKQRFQQVQAARQQGIATVPSVLGLEKRTNPFLCWDQVSLQTAMHSQDPIQTFARLRGKKDLY